ncbi:MAG: methylmalonyl-CoA epimerase [Candidatus Aureabacteria bacterium]|nr:methylmalonyl-CoA epimerase [Candidatus Auribacterota bacterium]NLW94597.1 methylmalonyl-CoA epimerase [Chlamydiota bacterium]HOE27070.1 methylmalonyl-CoA epimerase [bacterium]HQM52130.1 methylmalonyl-CoA epimerase [bacterium]
MIESVDHIGIAVRSIEASLPLYRDILHLREIEIAEVPEQKVRVAMIRVGGTKIELLEALGDNSPIARFIEKRGEGIHHIALSTNDIRAALAALKAAGLVLVNETPTPRAGEYEVAFIHPSSAGRVLIEICQPLT